MLPSLLRTYALRLAEDGEPASEADAELYILGVVHDVCTMLANSTSFGYHRPEDMYQEAYAEALKVLDLDKFRIEIKPLGNFLYSHIRNRLSNLKRKQFFRSEAPCKCCDAFNPGDTPCRRWHEWNRRNESKQRLMRPMSLDGDSNLAAPPDDPSETVILNELRSFIEQRLPPDLLEDYRLFADEGELSKSRRNRVRSVLRTILEDSPYAH